MILDVEFIPDEALLYKWFPPSKVDANGRPYAEAFEDRGSGMSTSWSKYCTAEECRATCKQPHRMTVIALQTGAVRAEPLPLAVVHSPRVWVGRQRQGLAHADVYGIKTAKVQVKLAKLAHVERRLPAGGWSPCGPANLRLRRMRQEMLGAAVWRSCRIRITCGTRAKASTNEADTKRAS